jgi:hypothetical protein
LDGKVLKRLRSIAWFVLAFTQIGCVNFVRPIGEWPEAVQTDLHHESLKDVVIGVECGKGSFDGTDFEPAILTPCREVVSLAKTMGATVEADEALLPLKTPVQANDAEEGTEEQALDTSSKPIITVTYVDRDYQHDWCGWTLLPMILSFWTFPCVADSEHRAELIITADNGVVLDRRLLRMHGKGYYGFYAFPLLAGKYIKRALRRGEGKGDHMRALYAYIRNGIYSGYVRRSLQKQAEFESVAVLGAGP